MVIPYEGFGNARVIFTDRSPELTLSGPAGTGKSLACLFKLHALALKYDGMRGGIVRHTRASLTQSALVTFNKKVQPERWGVRFHHQDQEYRYPNGSILVVGGLVPDISKVMSTEYDLLYVQEGTELTQEEAEALTTRMRNGVLPYQQLLMDCNPDAPTHWLRQRADQGVMRMLESRHEDNPTLWDHERGEWTEHGAAYIAKLDALTGVRKLRLRYGIWAAAEGMVFDAWDRNIHIIPHAALPPEWPRDLAIDFGYTNPFVAQCWAEDPDGRLILEWEIYKTQTLVEDHARLIVDRLGGKKPREIICDHDAEGRATFTRVTGWHTTNADKAVTAGIQDVQARMVRAGDGKPRIMLMENARIHPPDPVLVDAHKPTCTAEEIESYVWDDAKTKEQPVKADDHGCDAMRYECKRRARQRPGSIAFDAQGKRVA